mmetsp:Transcript_18315/g.51868  ORF Transcript_18315/g.51868 Transcript_18315/m.51868 type:complete len:243 (-) Transcript_18315:678-1406(-)
MTSGSTKPPISVSGCGPAGGSSSEAASDSESLESDEDCSDSDASALDSSEVESDSLVSESLSSAGGWATDVAGACASVSGTWASATFASVSCTVASFSAATSDTRRKRSRRLFGGASVRTSSRKNLSRSSRRWSFRLSEASSSVPSWINSLVPSAPSATRLRSAPSAALRLKLRLRARCLYSFGLAPATSNSSCSMSLLRPAAFKAADALHRTSVPLNIALTFWRVASSTPLLRGAGRAADC